MPTADYKPGKDDLGWWEHDTDPPHLTLFREEQAFGEMEDALPERFGAQPVGEVDKGVLVSLKTAMAEDGIENGSMELRYIEKVALDRIIPWLRQLIGSCVASGSMRNLATRSLIDILLLGDPEERLGDMSSGVNNLAPFAPYHYGWGRRFAGIRGGDGSTCQGQIKGLMTKGFLPCDTTGLKSDAFPEPQDRSTYRSWGNGRNLERFETAGKQFDLIESERITSGDHLRTKIVDEYKPCMICSSWAFKPVKRHKDGFWIYTRNRSDSWSHNLGLDGIRIASDGLILVRVGNSWGENAHKDGSFFYITLEEAHRWLKNSMCRSIGDLRLRKQEDFDLEKMFPGLRDIDLSQFSD